MQPSSSETKALMKPQTSNGHLLDVNNIEVVYNDIVQVLRGVSLSVPEGGIVALLGTNGAGKTTTLRAISGLLKPENGFIKDGYIKFLDNDITNVLGTHVVKLGAVMVPEGRRVFKHLTVDENIRVGSITRKDGARIVAIDGQPVEAGGEVITDAGRIAEVGYDVDDFVERGAIISISPSTPPIADCASAANSSSESDK